MSSEVIYIDLNANDPVRVRREFQRLSQAIRGGQVLSIAASGGLAYTGSDPAALTVVVEDPIKLGSAGVGLRYSAPLTVVATSLAITLNDPVYLNAAGIDLRLDASGGLQATGSPLALGVKLATAATAATSAATTILTLGSGGLGTQFVIVSGTSPDRTVQLTAEGNGDLRVLRKVAGDGLTLGISSSTLTGGNHQLKLENTQTTLGRVAGSHPNLTMTAADFKFKPTVGSRFHAVDSAGSVIFDFFDSAFNDAYRGIIGANIMRGTADYPLLVQPVDADAIGGVDLILRGANNDGVSSFSVADVVVEGGLETSANSPGGSAHIRGGKPVGTGTSEAKMGFYDSGGVIKTVVHAKRLVGTAGSDTTRNGLGFFGNAPIARPGTYTITAAPAVATALDADGNAGAAYTATPIALLNAATLADLNDARGDIVSLAAVLRQLIKHLGDTAGLGLLDETSY